MRFIALHEKRIVKVTEDNKETNIESRKVRPGMVIKMYNQDGTSILDYYYRGVWKVRSVRFTGQGGLGDSIEVLDPGEDKNIMPWESR